MTTPEKSENPLSVKDILSLKINKTSGLGSTSAKALELQFHIETIRELVGYLHFSPEVLADVKGLGRKRLSKATAWILKKTELSSLEALINAEKIAPPPYAAPTSSPKNDRAKKAKRNPAPTQSSLDPNNLEETNSSLERKNEALAAELSSLQGQIKRNGYPNSFSDPIPYPTSPQHFRLLINCSITASHQRIYSLQNLLAPLARELFDAELNQVVHAIASDTAQWYAELTWRAIGEGVIPQHATIVVDDRQPHLDIAIELLKMFADEVIQGI